MNSLGIRAFPDKYVFVILEGTQGTPVIRDFAICRPPAGSNVVSTLAWARKDLSELLTKHNAGCVVVKTVESNARSKDSRRLMLEGVLIEAAASHACSPTVVIAVKATIKSKTNFNDFARYLDTLLDSTALSQVNGTTYGEATLAALAGLPR